MDDADTLRDLARRFATAYDQRGLEALVALLAEDATALVVDSPFPEEIGRAVIAHTSLPHILGDGSDPLRAEPWASPEATHVLLREASGDRALDTAIRLQARGGRITRLEYLVTWHAAQDLARIAQAIGASVRSP